MSDELDSLMMQADIANKEAREGGSVSDKAGEEKVEWIVSFSKSVVYTATVTVVAADREDACEEAEDLVDSGEVDWEMQDPYGCEGADVIDCEEVEL